jgi:hypothetical protein
MYILIIDVKSLSYTLYTKWKVYTKVTKTPGWRAWFQRPSGLVKGHKHFYLEKAKESA